MPAEGGQKNVFFLPPSLPRNIFQINFSKTYARTELPFRLTELIAREFHAGIQPLESYGLIKNISFIFCVGAKLNFVNLVKLGFNSHYVLKANPIHRSSALSSKHIVEQNLKNKFKDTRKL